MFFGFLFIIKTEESIIVRLLIIVYGENLIKKKNSSYIPHNFFDKC